ncbi:ABC transporter permease [Nocardioides alcanivorans]|uniref:ABC transporter permease n=1 Tax=Nocardioides alcanivorans TaxID=2897352 RepID=UPI001F1A7F82|nr:ABC transporter permease [Nocardioides alcanivorans]
MLRAALKSLLGRKVRLLMSTFAIVLGVGFVGGSLIFGDTLNRSFTALFASTVGDVVVRPAGSGDNLSSSTVSIPAELQADLETVEGAARVDGNITAVGIYVIGDNGQPVGGNGPPALGGNYTDAPAGHGLEGLDLLDGRLPEHEGEIALDELTADKAGYDIGDTVPLVTTTKVPEMEVELVGIIGFSEGGSLNGATFTVFDTSTAQQLFLEGKDAYNDYWVTAEDGVTQEELRDRVAEVLPDDLEAVTGDDAADEAATQLIDQLSFITTFLLIFAVIALVVGSFLIVNTFSILVAQRSRELALLRALGASRRQVKGMVLLEAFVLGLIGAVLGLGLGVLLFVGIRFAFSQFGLDLASTPMVFAPSTVLAAFAIGVGVTMFAAWLPARRTGRIPPVAALRDDVALPETTLRRRFLGGALAVLVGAGMIALALFGDPPRAGYVLGIGALAVLLGVASASPVLGRPVVAAAAALFRRLHGTVGQLAGQNLQRNPRRTAATASALMIGLALCTTMAIVGSSAKASVDEAVAENFVGDYVVSNVFGVGFSPTIADRAAEIDGVETITRFRTVYTKVEGR